MTLMPLTQEQSQALLQHANVPLDGSWEVKESPLDGGYDIVPKTSQSPPHIEGNQQPGYGGNNSSSLGSFARGLATNALPAIGGSTATAIGAALAPETGGLSLAIPILSGIAGGALSSVGQKALMNKVLPAQTTAQINQQQQEDEQQHPIASLLGGASSAILGGLNPSPGNVMRAGGSLLNLLRGGANSLGEGELANLTNVGLGAGIQGGIAGGQNLYQQMQSPQPVDYSALLGEVAKQGGLGALFNKPNIVGREVFKFHGGEPEKQNRQYQPEQPQTPQGSTAQPISPEEYTRQQAEFDKAEAATNKGAEVPFSAVKKNEDGSQEYIRSYKDLQQAIKKVAPGLEAQYNLPEDPLELPQKVGLDQPALRKLIDQHLGVQQEDTSVGGLGKEGMEEQAGNEEQEKQVLEQQQQQAEQERQQRATDYQKALAEKVSQQHNENAPSQDTIRLYHGGQKPEGPVDITPSLDYAQGYAKKSGGKVWYVDVPSNAPWLKRAYDDTGLPVKSPVAHQTAPSDVMLKAKEFTKPLTENQIKITKPSLEQSIKPNQIPAEDRVPQEEQQQEAKAGVSPAPGKDENPEGRTFKGTVSSIDALRKEAELGNVEKKSGRHLADQLTKAYNYKQELQGKWTNRLNEVVSSLEPKQRDNVRLALEAQRDNGRDMSSTLRTTKEVQAYNKIHNILQDQYKEQIANNQPVTTSKGNLRKAINDPHFFPSQVDREVADIIRTNKPKNSIKITKWQNDFEDQQRANKATPDQARERWDNLVSQIRGDLSNPRSGTNEAFFNGVRKQEGIPLPTSMREKDLGRLLNSYSQRRAADMSWYKHIESDPAAASALGYKKSGWNEDIHPFVQGDNPSLMGNEHVRDIVSHYRGEVNPQTFSAKNTHALEHATSVGILGPLTQIHKLLSSVAQTISYAHPSEVLQSIYKGITDNVGGWERAVDTGGAHVSPRTAGDNMRMLVDSSKSIADKLHALSDLAVKTYTLGGSTDRFTTGFLQAAGEHIMSSRIASANAGNAEAAKFLKYYDPDFKQGKTYTNKELDSMASRFANTIHGSKDPRTLPGYMTKDTEISAFLKLANWQISSTNSWMRNIYTPLTKGNPVPLLMSTLGATLGGYVIKKMREEVSGGTKAPIPDLAEILASDANKRAGLYGTKLEDNKDLIAYHALELSSLAGFGGIITSALKGAMDVMHKNKFSGMGTIFPLDEVATSTAEIGGRVAAALKSGDAGVLETLGRASTDWLKQNVQLVRVAVNNAEKYGGVGSEDYSRHKYAQDLGDERRFQMASGLPYEDQSNLGSEGNPYLNLEASKYKHNQDLSSALTEQLPAILHKYVNLYGDKPQVLLDKIQALKQNGYETEPNPDKEPMELASYNKFLGMTQGESEATSRLVDYLKHRAVNEVKSSALP